MPRTFVHLAFFLFIITALSGIWMRFIPFFQSSSIDYDNILHAHSHIALLGWAFFGVFIIFLTILWPKLEQKRQATYLTITIFIVSMIMFFSFLYEGYGKYSIIMSTLHIFVEYWAIYFIYRQLKLNKQLPKVAKLFINGSLIALFLSTIGPFLLGYLGATGMRDSDFFEMTIYFFLHFQYNGWLFLFLIGLFILMLDKYSLQFSSKLFRLGFWIYFITLFPWYFSAISWTGISKYDKLIATTGTIGQWISMIIILTAVVKAWKHIKKAFPRLILVSLIGTFLLLFFKATMELGLISAPLSSLVFDTRTVVIGYLHFTLLGFVSLFILTQYQMVYFININRLLIIGITTFIVGFIINELLLFTMGLLSWIKAFAIPYTSEGLLLSSIILLIGITLVWLSFFISQKKQET